MKLIKRNKKKCILYENRRNKKCFDIINNKILNEMYLLIHKKCGKHNRQ